MQSSDPRAPHSANTIPVPLLTYSCVRVKTHLYHSWQSSATSMQLYLQRVNEILGGSELTH